MSEEKYLIDTDILFSKKYVKFRGKGIITIITLYELITIVRSRYLDMLKRGYKNRAEGYLRFLNIILNDIKNSVIGITEFDILNSINIIFERELSVGDAINVTIAKRSGMTIVSNDKDYERVKDLVNVIRT
ncbi:type II toxin-antitoxin system VapC family toxin [Acidianus brierleyi]|uniref:type II toxin-antitoxin system VapC family toxin n=1 Tax=Acidianus brierleyi TaxID=41673 RepID=UPI0013A55EE0|nr:PIN domain-containing protein [Acidianus brierleyi]